MITIQLTKGQQTIIDDCDADLAQLKWCYLSTGYAVRAVLIDGKSKMYLLHRVIMERSLGKELPSRYAYNVDHKDGKKLNNTRANLRLATSTENSMNTGKNARNTSGYKGVSFFKRDKKWKAQININKRVVNLGYYDTPEEAHAVYLRKAEELYGEFARGA